MSPAAFSERSAQLLASDPDHGRVAQLVEQRIENPRVDSSILSPATIFFSSSRFLL